MVVIIFQILFLFLVFILFIYMMFFTNRGKEFFEKLRRNPNFYSQRGAIEEIAEQNRAIIRRVVQIEERMGEVEKMVKEPLRLVKRNDGDY